MTGAPIISAQGLRKEYVIHKHQSTSLKEMVVKNLFVPGERVPLVALDDVSFELEPGRSLAIVGSNGSGKSTLLKLISGITEPSSGSLTASGRIAALLELGAGFELEFTGMENIFLQCSILGFSRDEILERLQPILDFCQLDQFIHTPVKRYSSGMRVRLGFAIAAHVDADILLLDEILAVGDTAFQMKCVRKIEELRQRGKTILFVSHMLEHIETIADKVLWLDKGKVVAFGEADDILPKFYESLHGGDDTTDSQEVDMNARSAAALPVGRFAAKKARLRRVQFLDEKGGERRTFHMREKVLLRTEIEVREEVEKLEVSFALGTMDALRAAWSGSGGLLEDVEPGVYTVEALIEDHHLAPGRYLGSVMLGDPRDITVTYDLHLRLYALSFYDDRRRVAHKRETGRLQSIGVFDREGE